MKLTDEMVEAAAKAQHHERYPWVVWENLKPQSREYYRNEVRVAVTAAFAHLTDDGAADTPPAEGVRSAQAAESATPVGAGAAAPSSPHLTHDQISAAVTKAVAEYRGYLVFDGCGTVAADAVLALIGEGATPAASRDALTELLRFNRHAPYVSNERLADMVAALIEGAS